MESGQECKIVTENKSGLGASPVPPVKDLTEEEKTRAQRESRPGRRQKEEARLGKEWIKNN